MHTQNPNAAVAMHTCHHEYPPNHACARLRAQVSGGLMAPLLTAALAVVNDALARPVVHGAAAASASTAVGLEGLRAASSGGSTPASLRLDMGSAKFASVTGEAQVLKFNSKGSKMHMHTDKPGTSWVVRSTTPPGVATPPWLHSHAHAINPLIVDCAFVCVQEGCPLPPVAVVQTTSTPCCLNVTCWQRCFGLQE